MICALRLCLLGLLVVAATGEMGRYDADEEYSKRAALADFRKRFDRWGPEETGERGEHSREKDDPEHRHQEKRAALADFKRAALADFKRAALADFKRAALADFKRAALADFKRAALADFKRAALADFKRAALADFKRAALADFKRAALADFKRAALADFKRAALADFKRSDGQHQGKAHHTHSKAEGKQETKRKYYWDICTRVENGEAVEFACKKQL